MSMRVRPARADDRPAMLDLWERSVRATHHFLTESDIVGLRPFVADVLTKETLGWWVLASETDAPIGFLAFANDTIEALFMDPDHRGRGGGTLLIAHAEGLATRPLAVDVNEQNTAAVAFYSRAGFAVVGRSPVDSAGRPFPLLHMKRPAT